MLFARNAGTAHELRELVAALRAGAAPPPLIAVDQEGGRVERVRDGVAALPPAMAFAAANDVALTERAGVLLGRDLARAGITVNLAPVADLALHAGGTVIATRAYGDDP
ncbi:MAG TPA: glycoside hydrolase family 3 N-terminal domain-containing protein, partial [Candidatus Elarobacter sp.]|nr:glycoside hydrolase family 3 N-terminal domain-containing protein [Candidatus Elarobacter sp.]